MIKKYILYAIKKTFRTIDFLMAIPELTVNMQP